ncbi:MAG: adenosylcobinamide-phosphate synthase CbiB [Pseudomonadota bacterium]
MSLIIALILDALFGEPKWLWDRVPHPAVVIGKLIGWLEQRMNRGAQRMMGVMMIALMISLAWVVARGIGALPFGEVLTILLAAILLAQRSLVDHVRAVSDALRISLAEGRDAVAKIVGRDVTSMDEAAVTRSAIESAAENFSDGVVAPAFWFMIFGLPGILIYKVINTADSMVGYRNARYEAFGWASAKLDDVANWVPARLSAMLIMFAYLRWSIWPVIRRDALLHRSPNAGWPEAAMAAILGIALSGPRSYDGQMQDFPFVFDEGRHQVSADDIDRSVAVLWRAWGLCLVMAILFATAS